MKWTKAILAGSAAAVALGMSLTQAVEAAEYKFLLMGALVRQRHRPS